MIERRWVRARRVIIIGSVERCKKKSRSLKINQSDTLCYYISFSACRCEETLAKFRRVSKFFCDSRPIRASSVSFVLWTHRYQHWTRGIFEFTRITSHGDIEYFSRCTWNDWRIMTVIFYQSYLQERSATHIIIYDFFLLYLFVFDTLKMFVSYIRWIFIHFFFCDNNTYSNLHFTPSFQDRGLNKTISTKKKKIPVEYALIYNWLVIRAHTNVWRITSLKCYCLHKITAVSRKNAYTGRSRRLPTESRIKWDGVHLDEGIIFSCTTRVKIVNGRNIPYYVNTN